MTYTSCAPSIWLWLRYRRRDKLGTNKGETMILRRLSYAIALVGLLSAPLSATEPQEDERATIIKTLTDAQLSPIEQALILAGDDKTAGDLVASFFGQIGIEDKQTRHDMAHSLLFKRDNEMGVPQIMRQLRDDLHEIYHRYWSRLSPADISGAHKFVKGEPFKACCRMLSQDLDVKDASLSELVSTLRKFVLDPRPIIDYLCLESAARKTFFERHTDQEAFCITFECGLRKGLEVDAAWEQAATPETEKARQWGMSLPPSQALIEKYKALPETYLAITKLPITELRDE